MKQVFASLALLAPVFLLPVIPVSAQVDTCEPKKIVVLGDSLVAGYGLAPGEAFPEKLQEMLVENGYSVEIVNAGVSGDTSTAGLARLDWSVGDDADAVIVELGANDALRGISPQLTGDNLEAIVSRLKGRDIEVVLAGMLAPPNMGAAYADKFNPIYPDLAGEYDLLLYPFFLDGVAANEALNQDDGMHPTADGVKLIVERFFPLAEAMMKSLCTQPS
jgi:acyl-CoA thioesterase-1